MSTTKDNPKKEKTIEKAKDAQDRLPKGKSTINQIRDDYGLNPIEHEALNEQITNKELSRKEINAYEKDVTIKWIWASVIVSLISLIISITMLCIVQ